MVACTEDRGTPAAAQREFSRRADKVIEVKAGHHVERLLTLVTDDVDWPDGPARMHAASGEGH
jgi:hypothetical protein